MKRALNTLFYILCGAFTLGQIGKISFLGQQINAYVYELPLVIFTLYLLFRYKNEPVKQILHKTPTIVYLPGYLLLIFIFTAAFYPVHTNVVGFLYLARLIMYLTFFIYLYYYAEKENKFKRILWRGIASITGATVFLSAVQYFLYPNLRNISYLGWDPHWYRVVGTYLDPPVTGAIFGMLFIYFFYSQISVKWKVLIMTLLFTGVAFTYSRGTFLAFFLVLPFLFFKRRMLLGVAVMLFILCLIFAVLPRPYGESVNLMRTFSIQSRIENYKEAVTLWAKHPLIGVGYNRIRYTRDNATFLNNKDLQNNHAGASFHSSFLIMLVTGGVIGLGLFTWLLYSLAKLNTFTWWSTIFLSILSLTDNVLLHPFVLVLYFILIVSSGANIFTRLSDKK